MSELKPCPFCGAKGVIIDLSHPRNPDVETYHVDCLADCDMGMGQYKTREAAIAAWNTRASDTRIAELEAEVERLRARPKVKPLEWSAGHSAASPCGTYYVIPVDGQFAVSLNAMTIAAEYLGRFGTLDHAKAAAQADYEARILSALVQP
jgi:Lar family restriction alleviation protein